VKDLAGHASVTVAAPLEHCHAFLAAVEGYTIWHPEVVRSVEVLERDDRGTASQIRARLHAALGPATRDFDVVMAVRTEDPTRVTLARLARDSFDDERFEVDWRLAPAGPEARISLELNARLSVPRLMPVGGLGDSLTRGFVEAARRALAPASHH
jgi:Polyketide cyclase / dehydrase and lipid transport